MHVNALGHYRKDCCPEYLTPSGFEGLKTGLIDRLSVHTATITEHLLEADQKYTKLVLLDHLDWLDPEALRAEWQAIVDKSAPGATILYRSALQSAAYVEEVVVNWQDSPVRLGELLHFERENARQLHERDRVHLYGSFSIANLK
jgi:S-adenosylmethionine-diacylglycerol 3-amino-3-carboxypropyl transferase